MEGSNVPAAPDRIAKLALQAFNLIPVQLPKVRMTVQPMPCFYRRDFSFEVDARGQVEQLLDDGAAGRPGGVELWGIRGSGHQGCRGHHHVVGWVGGGRVLIGDVGHAGVFQREDEIDGRGDGVGLGEGGFGA